MKGSDQEHPFFELSPNASCIDAQDALLEEAELLAANTSMLTSDAYEGFDDLTDDTKRMIMFGIWSRAETVLKLARVLASRTYGLRTDAALALRRRAARGGIYLTTA